MGSGTETDKETDRKTMRETDKGDGLGYRLGHRPGDRQGDFKIFLREFLKTNGALPVTGGRGGHYFGHGSASSVPLKPLFLKCLGDTSFPFSSEKQNNLSHLSFS